MRGRFDPWVIVLLLVTRPILLGAQADEEDPGAESSSSELPTTVSWYHPYILFWFIQAAIAFVPFGLSMYGLTRPTLAIIILSGLTYVVSYVTGQKIWDLAPGDYTWWCVVFKWVLVNLFAAVPMLSIPFLKPSAATQQKLGFLIYGVLGLNVLWTLAYGGDLPMQKINAATGVVLTVTLIVHCVSLCRRNIPFLELDENVSIVYGRGTSLSWCICYSVWNALFAGGHIAASSTLQVILLWCIMCQLYYYSGLARPIEDYASHARVIQLSMWIMGDGLGLISYFRDVEDAEVASKKFDGIPYYLFLAYVNLAFGLVILSWSVIGLVNTEAPLRKFDSRLESGFEKLTPGSA